MLCFSCAVILLVRHANMDVILSAFFWPAAPPVILSPLFSVCFSLLMLARAAPFALMLPCFAPGYNNTDD